MSSQLSLSAATDFPYPDNFHFTLDVVDRICDASESISHDFMDDAEYKALLDKNFRKAIRIYWREMLARMHIGAVCSILRSRAWLKGLEQAWASGHFYLYCAAMRGLLESTADTWYSYRAVPMGVAKRHYLIRRSIAGKSKIPYFPKDLEDSLIHFTHARKLAKAQEADTPESHASLLLKNYLESLGQESEDAKALYDRLCAFTHPSAESLMPFVGDYTSSTWQLVRWPQRKWIEGAQQSWAQVFTVLLMKSFNLPLVTLKLLNTFNDAAFRTASLEQCDLSPIPVWREVEAAIGASERT